MPRVATAHLANFEEALKIPLNHEKMPYSKQSNGGGGGGGGDVVMFNNNSMQGDDVGSFDTNNLQTNNNNNNNIDQNEKEPTLYVTDDHPQNRRGFRYSFCVANPILYPALQYTSAELAPFRGTVSLFDRSPAVALSLPNRLSVSTPKGFVSARADLCMREGHWYYECKVNRANDGTGAHVRLGVSRREASLEAPVGFDAYGYGIRDVGGQAVHLSKLVKFMEEPVVTGDVLGFHVYLPAPEVNKKGSVESMLQQQQQQQQQLWRDRIAIKYKGLLYFEHLEYQPTKEMEELIVPLPEETSKTSSTGGDGGKGGGTGGGSQKKKPFVVQKLQGSFIRVYKNGKYMGQPFTDLNSFAPPNSKHHQLSSRGGGGSTTSAAAIAAAAAANSNLSSADDGLLGYFPTASVFRGGTVTFNFGPDFGALPKEVAKRMRFARCSGYGQRYAKGVEGVEGTQEEEKKMKKKSEDSLESSGEKEVIRPLCERYEEQIAEDVVQDIVDEVDFELQDLLEQAADR